MSRKDWTSGYAIAAYDDGHQDGIYDAARQLMDRLADAGCRDDGWNGGDVVELVDQWLQAKGVDTHVYECEPCEAAFYTKEALAQHDRDEHQGELDL